MLVHIIKYLMNVYRLVFTEDIKKKNKKNRGRDVVVDWGLVHPTWGHVLGSSVSLACDRDIVHPEEG